MTYVVGNTGPGLGQAHKWGMAKSVNGITTAIQLLTNDKKPTDSLPLKKNTSYDKNEWQHKNGQNNSRVNEMNACR